MSETHLASLPAAGPQPLEPAEEELIARYPEPRSALLPLLHHAQERRGFLAEEDFRRVGGRLGLSPAEVASVASFYRLFRRQPEGRHVITVCTNLSCTLCGARELLDHLRRRLGIADGETTPDGAFTLEATHECLAACDGAPAVQVDLEYHLRVTPPAMDELLERLRGAAGRAGDAARVAAAPAAGELAGHAARADAPAGAGPAGPQGAGTFEPILTRRPAGRDLGRLADYEAEGGYRAWRKVLTEMTPQAVAEAVNRSGLRGRGGAGFPTGRKWGFLPADGRPRYLCCNADESEPGTFKDRQLIEEHPHQLLEGVLICAYAIGARLAFIYVRGEFLRGYRRLASALAEARANGYVGPDVLGTGHRIDIVLHRGAGAYICGEETALLNSLEGRRGEPRLKPPFPAVSGLYGQPTVVNNVETLSCLPHIILRGAEWFASLGPARGPGPKIFSVSGHVRRPGNYELPLGTPLRDLIFTHAGGMREGRRFKAVLPGGGSSGCLTEAHLDTPLDFDSLAQAGSMLGSGGVIVLDDSACLVRAAAVLTRFYADESCGQCTPCREGISWLARILERMEAGQGQPGDLDVLMNLAARIPGTTICPHADAGVGFLASALRYFPEEFSAHAEGKGCRAAREGARPA